MAIGNALNNPAGSSPAFVTAAVKWAQDVAGMPARRNRAVDGREEAIVTAAATRCDGGEDLVVAHGKWIRETLGRAFGGKNDPVHRTRAGSLQSNRHRFRLDPVPLREPLRDG